MELRKDISSDSVSYWGSYFKYGKSCVCVCETLGVTGIILNWFPVSCLYSSREVRHDCGTALNEATTIMGYRV